MNVSLPSHPHAMLGCSEEKDQLLESERRAGNFEP